MKDVIARLEAAAEGSRELDVLVIRAVFGYGPDQPLWSGLHYTTSIDAALTLVPAHLHWIVRDGAHLTINGDRRPFAHIMPHGEIDFKTWVTWAANAATPALALCIAALKARLATEGGAPEPVRGESAEALQQVTAENQVTPPQTGRDEP